MSHREFSFALLCRAQMPDTFVKCEKRLRATSQHAMYAYDCCSDCDVVFRNASKNLDR